MQSRSASVARGGTYTRASGPNQERGPQPAPWPCTLQPCSCWPPLPQSLQLRRVPPVRLVSLDHGLLHIAAGIEQFLIQVTKRIAPVVRVQGRAVARDAEPLPLLEVSADHGLD